MEPTRPEKRLTDSLSCAILLPMPEYVAFISYPHNWDLQLQKNPEELVVCP